VPTLQFLEGIRCFFDTSGSFAATRKQRPVRIIAFSSERQYAPYAFREVGNGYYRSTFSDRYLVLANVAPQNRELLAHEYTHFIIDQAGLKLPVWLNEGLAEFYSSVEVTGQQATIGLSLPRSWKTLHTQPLIPWNVLFTAELDSPYYHDANKVYMFYAQSWALVHMLALNEGYGSHFRQFVSAVSGGQTPPEAFESIYHKDARGIGADLATYISQKSLPNSVVQLPQPVPAIHPAIAPASDFQVQFALADLLCAKSSSLADAQSKLAALATRYPERPEPEEALGELALQQQHQDEARTHLARAVQRHSRQAEVYQQYAALLQQSGTKTDVAPYLKQALELDPDFSLARAQLGLIETAEGNCESGISLLTGLKAVPSEYRFEVYHSLAECDSELQRGADALTYAQKAKNAAKNEQEARDADKLLADLTGGEKAGASADGEASADPPPLTNVRGRSKALECSDGHQRLHVTVENREMTFDVDPSNVVVRNGNENYSHWRCGALKPEALTIVYTPLKVGSNASSQASDGKVRELIF